MNQTLFGVETEYACVPVLPANLSDSDMTVPDQLVQRARETLAHLPDRRSSGIFLGNGARFYVDCGSHPEYATPECDNPWDVVRHVLAGDRILAALAADVASGEGNVNEVSMFKHNVDLSGSGATWGCHESYLHRIAPDELAPQIIPHLVSRIIYSGAGGFHPLAPAGLEFSVSPRVAHITRTKSPDSTANRGIYHTKDEALARGYHRLHLICGESLCSHLAAWLKVGTTALIVALADAGLRPWETGKLRIPLNAFRTFAADPTCTAEVPLTNGDSLTAIKIQETYLALAEANLQRSFMPSWASEVCTEWRSMLTRLKDAPTSVDRTLDWAIKWSLYDQRLRRRLLTWDRIAQWHPVVTRLKAALVRADCPADTRVDVLLGDKSQIPDDVKKVTKLLRPLRLEWSELVEIDALRRELYEVETRFSQLGDRGIFGSLDRAGVLSHRVAGVDQIEEATSHAPEKGRAHTRGAAVQRLSGERGWNCDWSGVFNGVRGARVLDLSDPFKRRGLQALDRRVKLPPDDPEEAARPATDDSVETFLRFFRGRLE